MSRYELIREIGRGGMGVVYQGRMVLPTGDVIRVAIKRMKTMGMKQLELFSREAAMSLQINNNHPNLITTHHFGMSHQGPYIVMEFVDGISLHDLGASGKLDYPHIRRIARDTLSALAHVHNHDVVHRDVSPGNILISRDGVTKLADLGLVRAVDKPLSGDFRGTTAYASPEALQGAGVGPRSDLYSLGVVLYEVITRKLPYGKGEPLHVFGNMTAGAPAPLPEETPADLARMITGMMALDAEDRAFTSATGAIALLDAHGEPMADDAELGALVESCIGTRSRDESEEGTSEHVKPGKGDTEPFVEVLDPVVAMFDDEIVPERVRARSRVPWSVVAVAAVVLLAGGLGVLGGMTAAERSGEGSGDPGTPMVECAPASPAPFPASELAADAASEDAPAPVEPAPAHAPVENAPAPGPIGVASPDMGQGSIAQSRPATPRKRERRAWARPSGSARSAELSESARPGQPGESARPLYYRVPRVEPADWHIDNDKETHKP